MPGDKIQISKDEVKKPRRKWVRRPATKIKESKKIYKRQRIKQNIRTINNAKNNQ